MKRILCVGMILLLMLCPLFVGTAQYDTYYSLGDVAEDFTLIAAGGETLTLSELLQEHKAVLLNFWFSACGPSRYEFPHLQKAYELFGGDVAVVGITPYDDDATILQYREALGLTFPLAYDSLGLTDRFVDYGFPTNVLIDRNGVICYIECGAQSSSDAFSRLLTPFVQDEYTGPLLLSSVPTIILPDAPNDGALNAALNAEGGALAFYCPQGSWPWIVSEDGSYVATSNSGYNSTVCQLETQLYAQAGDALSFRFRTSTEEGSDLFVVMVNYEIVKAFSGENGWTSYALPMDRDGLNTVTFEYIKSDMDAAGNDEAALDDVALLHGEDAQAALASNPSYPLTLRGKQARLSFLDQEAKRIVFDDPSGLVDAYFHGDSYYIVQEQEQRVRVELGRGFDPDAAFIRDLSGKTQTLSHCDQDEKGFYFTCSAPEAQLGWNALMLIPSITDAYGQYASVYLYFSSEEAVDAFCREQIPDYLTGEPVEGITWQYAE